MHGEKFGKDYSDLAVQYVRGLIMCKCVFEREREGKAVIEITRLNSNSSSTDLDRLPQELVSLQ